MGASDLVLTAGGMRAADRAAIERAGISALTLMENAGRAVAKVLGERRGRPDRRVLIFCGRGGNGGDGLVLLRVLRGTGARASALVLASEAEVGGEAGENLRAARRLGLDVRACPDEASLEEALSRLAKHSHRSDVLVDAIAGTGGRGRLRGLGGVVATAWNGPAFASAYRVAIDVPTGLDADSGRVPGPFLRADFTVALGARKICHVVSPAAHGCGDVRVVDIGIPAEFLTMDAGAIHEMTDAEARELVPRRRPDSHKGDFGRLLIVAGSARMPGAAALAALGALRSGAGLVTVAAPEPVLAGLPPEAMRLPLPSTADGEIAGTAAAAVAAATAEVRAEAIVLGPGLGKAPETAEAIRQIVGRAEIPMVLDADGLNAFAGRVELLRRASAPLALTPHPGEAARLLDSTAAAIQEDRLAAVRELAGQSGVAVALKGARTLVATAEPPRVSSNPTGGPALATPGSGDVLSGVVGAFLARGLPPFDALRGAVFVHGLAGDFAACRMAEDGVIASDVAADLGNAIADCWRPDDA